MFVPENVFIRRSFKSDVWRLIEKEKQYQKDYEESNIVMTGNDYMRLFNGLLELNTLTKRKRK
jgi:hypothetical protein